MQRHTGKTAADQTDFRKLWAALTISLTGSEITALALPLTAVLALDASPMDVGILVAAGQLPFLLLSLPAGAWVDRLRRRPVLIAADIGSAASLLTVPTAVLVGGPSFTQLCLVAFGVGAFQVMWEIAHYAYVPSVVNREQLTAVNSRLQLSYSATAAAGPGVGGLLIGLITAPLAIVADAGSFLVSAAILATIRRAEPAPVATQRREGLVRSIAQGLQMLLRHDLLRPLIVGGSVTALFESALATVLIVHLTRSLGLTPLTIGLIFASAGVGSMIGALIADRAARRFGVGPAIIAGWTGLAVTALAVPLAGATAITAVLIGVARGIGMLAFTVANVHQWTLRQTVTPDELLGRVTAGHRFVVYGAAAIGAIAGGAAAGVLGTDAALVACAVGMLGGPLIAAMSRLRGVKEQPGPVASTAESR